MAQTVIKNVTVEALSKFGFKADGKYVGWSKNFKEADKAQVVPGRQFEMELYIADSQKEYVNKILKQLEAPTTPPLVAPVFAKTPTAKEISDSPITSLAKMKASETMSKGEWAEKDTRISRQGVIQAAVQAVSHMGLLTHEDIFPVAEELANKMLGFVNQK